MSVAVAIDRVRKMVLWESHGPGDLDNAIRRIGERERLPFWSLWHLRKGKAKGCESSLYARIGEAYVNMCGRLATSFLREIIESGDDALDPDLVDRLDAILAEVAARKAQAEGTDLLGRRE